MSAYLYPNLKSKAAYRKAIAEGQTIIAKENTPFGNQLVTSGKCTFEGPHYPEPHRFYGQAIVQDGKVISIK